jgi:hypothetical protein
MKQIVWKFKGRKEKRRSLCKLKIKSQEQGERNNKTHKKKGAILLQKIYLNFGEMV